MFVAYLIFGIYPAGEESVLVLDLNGQYVYYYDYIYDVLHGDESVFYSWSRNLSGEFFGIIGYYLASPFNFIVWAFPREQIMDGLFAMLVVKVGAIGATMAIYLRRGRGMSGLTSLMFAVCYALSAYTIEQTMNPMWLDGVGALPLIIFGIESLVDKGKFKLLVISLAYAFITNFYIGYMLGIFAALYFLYYNIATNERDIGAASTVIKRGFLFGLSAVVSVAIAAFMLLPVYSSLSLGKFQFTTPDYSLRTNFEMTEPLTKLFPGSYDTVRMDGLPFLYCGTVVIIMLCCYFLSGKITAVSRRERVASAAFLVIMSASMYITPVDMLWHGGQMPNWLPQRYSFCVIFLLLLFAAKAFEESERLTSKLILGASLGLGFLALFLTTTDTFNNDLGESGRELFDGVTVVLPALAFIMLVGIMLIATRKHAKRNILLAASLLVVVCGEGFYNTLMQLHKQDADVTYSNRDTYAVISETRKAVNAIYADDDGFFRIEKDYFRTVNDPMALRMYGLSHSSSVLNAKPIQLLKDLGLSSRSHYTCYRGATPLIDDVFGVKYILSSDEADKGRTKTVGDIDVEKNDDALPIAYLASRNVTNLQEAAVFSELNMFSRQNALLDSLLGSGDTTEYIKTIDDDKLTFSSENVSISSAAKGHAAYKVTKKGSNAQIEYTFDSPISGELFMWLPSSYERKLNVWVNKAWGGNYYETDYYCVMSLGTFKQGESVDVILTLTKDDLYIQHAYFGYFDEEVYNQAIEQLNTKNSDTKVQKLSPTHLKIDVNATSNDLLFTTIPNEPGWKVTVDGKSAEITETLGALIGVNLDQGRHTIEMRFTPAYYPTAVYISIGGALVFAAMWFISGKLTKKNPRKGGDDDEFDDKEEEEYDEESESGEHDIDREKFLSDIGAVAKELEDLNDLDNPLPDHEQVASNRTHLSENFGEFYSPKSAPDRQ
jgi:uncharacterized membrane protein YfhO